MATMEITIFAKKRQTADGRKTFYTYLTTLTKKDGSPVTCAVKFSGDAESPDPLSCPMNIVVDTANCNMAREDYQDKNGDTRTAFRLWVKAYAAGSPYVDHSMDEFV